MYYILLSAELVSMDFDLFLYTRERVHFEATSLKL